MAIYTINMCRGISTSEAEVLRNGEGERDAMRTWHEVEDTALSGTRNV